MLAFWAGLVIGTVLGVGAGAAFGYAFVMKVVRSRHFQNVDYKERYEQLKRVLHGEGILTDQSPQEAPPEVNDKKSDSFYRKLVREHSGNLGSLTGEGSYNKWSRSAYSAIRYKGSRNEFSDVLVIKGGVITGSYNRGTILTPPGTSFEVKGSRNNVTQKVVSWEEIAKRFELI